jgi:hypothetical protein
VPRPLAPFLGQWDGAMPGPGRGIVLSANTPHPGRIFFAGHIDNNGPDSFDIAWFSDDDGNSFKLANGTWPHPTTTMARRAASGHPTPRELDHHTFPGLDEPQFTELRNGSILISMRRDCRGTGCRGTGPGHRGQVGRLRVLVSSDSRPSQQQGSI